MDVVQPVTITLAGDNTDTILGGAAVAVYGYSVVGTDGDLQFYNGVTAYDAGDPIAFFHRSGDAQKTVSFACGVVFKNGIYVEGSANKVVTILVEKI